MCIGTDIDLSNVFKLYLTVFIVYIEIYSKVPSSVYNDRIQKSLATLLEAWIFIFPGGEGWRNELKFGEKLGEKKKERKR